MVIRDNKIYQGNTLVSYIRRVFLRDASAHED